MFDTIVTAAFWKASFERGVKTFLQVYLAQWLVGDVAFNAFSMDWGGDNLGIALGAVFLSFVTSILSTTTGSVGPSIANEQLTEPVHPDTYGDHAAR